MFFANNIIRNFMDNCENKKKCKIGSIIVAVAIMVGLIVLGVCISNGFGKIADADRYVTVKGLAEREVMADKVTWTIPYFCVSNDIQDLYENLESDQEMIMSFLIENGIEESEIYTSTPSITDRLAGQYTPDRLEYRYSGRSAITVSTSKVDVVIEMMKQEFRLIKDGISIGAEYSSGSSASFEFTGLNKIKPEMIEEATRNAREVANKFAQDSGSELGGIKNANQGQFSIDSEETTPQIKKIRVVTTVDYILK